MASKRIGLLTGGLLAGALLLGTAGLAAAQAPASTPTPSSFGVGPRGMMGGQNGTGMMGGQMGIMSADLLKQMATLHDQMVKSGACDPAQMQELHAQHHASR